MERLEGLAHCCHHNTHFEYCYDFATRVEYIKTQKPENEQELRLRLFKILPEDRLPSSLVKAEAEYEKAGAEYYKAVAEYYGAEAEYDKARAEYDKARAEYYKAIRDNMPELMKLHDELFTDCTWDEKRQTIFRG